MNKNGVVLQESKDYVVIATGLDSSENEKTGDMIQVYILYRHVNPVEAVRQGKDRVVCIDCKHMGESGFEGRRCYVNVGQAPYSVWGAYQRGSYRKATLPEYGELFGGRVVRLGAYGEPSLIRPGIIRGITSKARAWTGYTHQWRRKPSLRGVLMASVDTPSEADQAAASGWRYFRVTPFGDANKLQGEISCPASAEAGKRTVCADCKLCDGARHQDARKNIVIQDHSAIKRTNDSLIQIQGVR